MIERETGDKFTINGVPFVVRERTDVTDVSSAMWTARRYPMCSDDAGAEDAGTGRMSCSQRTSSRIPLP